VTIAVALGLVLMFVVRAIVKRRADNLDIVLAPPVATPASADSGDPAEPMVAHLDAYRYRRARAAGHHHESHSAS
jgi:hypothetical protein